MEDFESIQHRTATNKPVAGLAREGFMSYYVETTADAMCIDIRTDTTVYAVPH